MHHQCLITLLKCAAYKRGHHGTLHEALIWMFAYEFLAHEVNLLITMNFHGKPVCITSASDEGVSATSVVRHHHPSCTMFYTEHQFLGQLHNPGQITTQMQDTRPCVQEFGICPGCR